MLTWNKDETVSVSLRIIRGAAVGAVIFSGMGLMHPSFEPSWADQAILFVALITVIASFVKIEG